ncbi:XdhC family protein [Streptomyces sp. NPDC052701]|uniref:XdhC family protein n=1 Tax=Streptomyces sp. NPDC052701 TaxID=3155533 RepID=UPI00343F8C0F
MDIGGIGSAPLPVGASLAVDEAGHVVGSISGGCVEAAVHDVCRQVLHDRGSTQRARFGYSDDGALTIGLTCGGELDAFVRRNAPAARPRLAMALDLAAPTASATSSRRRLSARHSWCAYWMRTNDAIVRIGYARCFASCPLRARGGSAPAGR